MPADIDFRDLGYCTVYTGESWEQLLAAVSGLIVLDAADRAALREGWDEAQLDREAFERDMAERAA